jgi:transposase-like protein
MDERTASGTGETSRTGDRGDDAGVSRRRKRHSPQQIVDKLRDAEVLLGQGLTVAQVAQRLGVSEVTYHRWRNQYGGMKADEARRLKELEQENAKLKKLVAEQALDISMLKEIAKGEF